MPARYVSKPQYVEAVRWIGDNLEQIRGFVGSDRVSAAERSTPRGIAYDLMIKAGPGGESGWVFVPHGHMIVRWVDDSSDYWPVAHDHFADKYEPVDTEGGP